MEHYFLITWGLIAAGIIGAVVGESTRRAELCNQLKRSFSLKALSLWLTAPLGWILLNCVMLVYLFWGLGRWPHFGEKLGGLPSVLHHGVWFGLGGLTLSLFAVGFLLPLMLLIPRCRVHAVYLTCYAAGVGLAWLALLASPGPYLNWLFD